MSGGIIVNHNFSTGLAGADIMTKNNLKFSRNISQKFGRF
jgi:hypothetical protein